MTQSQDNTTFEQQKSESQVAGLKNQVEDNLNDMEKPEDAAAEGIAENLEQAKSK